MTIAQTDAANTFTAAQISSAIDAGNLTLVATGAGGGLGYDYRTGNIIKKTLTGANSWSNPYRVPFPVDPSAKRSGANGWSTYYNVPSGYTWTLIFIQDSTGGHFVQIPIYGVDYVPITIFPNDANIGIGLGPNQVTIITGIWDVTLGYYLCSYPTIYK